MPAYNPPPQVLFSPVTNYYQGKAIRAGLEEQKVNTELKRKQSELLTQEIADAPSKRPRAYAADSCTRARLPSIFRDGGGRGAGMNAEYPSGPACCWMKLPARFFRASMES